MRHHQPNESDGTDCRRTSSRQERDGDKREYPSAKNVDPQRTGQIVTERHRIQRARSNQRDHQSHANERSDRCHDLHIPAGNGADGPESHGIEGLRIEQRDRGTDTAKHGRQRDAGQHKTNGRRTVTARRPERVNGKRHKDRAQKGEPEISIDGVKAE
ncbi:hypothetical protein D3C80_172370 [compost metagenome]